VSEQIDNFRKQLRAKVDDADTRLKGLEANVKASGEKAKSDAKGYLASLESGATAQKAKLQAAEADIKTWVQEKKKITDDKIAEWKAKRHVTELTRYADLSERYAAAATQVAASAIDEAEKAIADAVVARINVNAAQPTSAAKSA
jgi:hypothetical protein